MTTTALLGDRIREARGTLTQDDLAAKMRARRPKMKVSGVLVSRWERGIQEPRLSAVVAIAEATGKSLDFFRVDGDDADDGRSGDEDDDEDSDAMMRAAYVLDRSGDYTIADDLRRRARKAKLRALRSQA